MIHYALFPDPLEFRKHAARNGSTVFELTHFFRYMPADLPTVTVPAHFLTDGASIPRPFWSLMGPFGQYFDAAVVHDFLYSPKSTACHRGIDRKLADRIFLQAMIDCGVGFWTRQTIYRAVRAFGWMHYKKSHA